MSKTAKRNSTELLFKNSTDVEMGEVQALAQESVILPTAGTSGVDPNLDSSKVPGKTQDTIAGSSSQTISNPKTSSTLTRGPNNQLLP